MSRTACPFCGSTWIDPLYSMNKMMCFKCNKFRPFKLKPGQKSLLIKGLVGSDGTEEATAYPKRTSQKSPSEDSNHQ